MWYPVILLIPGTLKFTGQLFGSPIQTKLAFILRSVVRSWIFAGGFSLVKSVSHMMSTWRNYTMLYIRVQLNAYDWKTPWQGLIWEIQTRFSLIYGTNSAIVKSFMMLMCICNSTDWYILLKVMERRISVSKDHPCRTINKIKTLLIYYSTQLASSTPTAC